MSSTNKTTNYNLSQFVGTDVPSYLGDYNGDMSKIDKAISDVANSQGSVEQSVVGLTADVQGLSTQVDGMGTSVQQLQTTVAQIDSGYKQADTALSQRITTNANNIQTNTTAIESANTAIGNINTTIGTDDISGIGDGTIKGAISNINSSLMLIGKTDTLYTGTSAISTINLAESFKNYKFLLIDFSLGGIVKFETYLVAALNVGDAIETSLTDDDNNNGKHFIGFVITNETTLTQSRNCNGYVRGIYGIK